MTEGTVVITTDSGQAGTVILVYGDSAQVLLANGEIWQGQVRMLRLPQSREELDAAPLNVERVVPKPRKLKSRRDDDD